MKPAADRQRRYRQRRARGQAVLMVSVPDFHSLINLLIDTGWLTELECEDRKQVAAATSDALEELITWHKKRNA
jgi:hypothetical protein